MSKFDPPWPRFAIRCSHKDGRESWFTDDGRGGDEAIDYTAWDSKRLVVHLDRDVAKRWADDHREYARQRKMTLCVVRVWEYPGGVYELTKRPQSA